MPEYELIIRNGLLVDGTGSDPRQADIAVSLGRIAHIGSLAAHASSKQEIDADGLAVAPGFIDIHTHADSKLLQHPDASNYLTQGVTTVIGGNCGGGPLPVEDFANRCSASRIGVNIGLLAGHNTVRSRVMESANRAPTPEELEQMAELVRQSMQEGAFGLSSGLKYIPGAYAEPDEVVALARVAAEHGTIYVTHMRDEGLKLLEALDESLSIAREGGLPLHVSHFKAVGKGMWGSAGRILGMVDKARSNGQDVTFDQYPYTASSTGLTVLFPPWALEGSREARAERCSDPAQGKEIRKGIVFNLEEDRGGGDPRNIVLVSSPYDPAFAGQDLGAVTASMYGKVSMENAAEAVIRLTAAGHHPCIFHCMSEDDVQAVMRHPAGLVASDSHIVPPDEMQPHPRNFGTFPRVLGHYVRELGLLSLPEAIRKMSGAVAQRLGLRDRGVLGEGQCADLVVFSPNEIAGRATWTDPKLQATGIHHVIVNGIPAIADGRPTGRLAGEFLRR